MKKLVITLVLVFISGMGVSQPRTVSRSFQVNKNEKIDLNLKHGGSINIKSWDKNKVVFKAIIEINQGSLNDALTLNFNHKERQLQITSSYNKEKLKNSHVQKCKGQNQLRYSVRGENKNYAICHKITYQIMLPKAVALNVQSINADIKVVGFIGPVRVKTISGFVDLSRPANIPTNVKLKTVSGKIYTDINITERKKNDDADRGYPPHIFKGTIKGGGDKLKLESISGNLYLRKVK